MKRVMVFPGKVSENDYLKNMVKAFESIGYAVDFFSVKKMLTSSFRGNILFINWLENQTRNKGVFGLFIIFAFLMISKLLGFKLVYVRHNKYSHNLAGRFNVALNKFSISLIQKFSAIVLCHGIRFSKLYDLFYIPHPCYFSREELESIKSVAYCYAKDDTLNIQNRMLIFGRIQPYKNVHTLLSEVSTETKLIIAGSFDPSYKVLLADIANKRFLDVIFEDRFVSDSELNSMIYLANSVVVSTSSNSCIMSGAIIHALNLTSRVVITDSSFLGELPGNLQDCLRTDIKISSEIGNCSDSEKFAADAFFESFSIDSVARELKNALLYI